MVLVFWFLGSFCVACGLAFMFLVVILLFWFLVLFVVYPCLLYFGFSCRCGCLALVLGFGVVLMFEWINDV